MPFGEDGASQGQTFNACLVNFQDKKLPEHQMGRK
jgi:hypothetical protein